ncbi:hypothetical protein PGT21_002523 [Puccinia graminis f. sp. tritici]|uniref:Uncharacterized protein n=1 Tax=Puccinia graminis f. sp. tritici TaxID=56615 RepID=A0A5B0QEC2_PUCGR|nr:hypothetical protein PGT21_002523 [Puccinia graminis f. sp. tritici]
MGTTLIRDNCADLKAIQQPLQNPNSSEKVSKPPDYYGSLSKPFRSSPLESISKPREFRKYFEKISKSYWKVFGGPLESLSQHVAKCTWTKVQDVCPCGRIFQNISKRTSEMFRTPAPVVYCNVRFGTILETSWKSYLIQQQPTTENIALNLVKS